MGISGQEQNFHLPVIFLGRGRGGQRSGRGYPPHRGRPPIHPQPTPYYREQQWKEQFHWERDHVQQQDPRKEDHRVVGPEEGSKKKNGGKWISGLGGIYNLSDVIMTHKEMNILNLGLKSGLKRPISKFDICIGCT